MGNRQLSWKTWGNWIFDPQSMTLDFRLPGDNPDDPTYYVNLDWATTSAEILDWLCQIQGKPWASDKDIADLLRAFNDLADGLQAEVCSGGVECGPINWKHCLLLGPRSKMIF